MPPQAQYQQRVGYSAGRLKSLEEELDTLARVLPEPPLFFETGGQRFGQLKRIQLYSTTYSNDLKSLQGNPQNERKISLRLQEVALEETKKAEKNPYFRPKESTEIDSEAFGAFLQEGILSSGSDRALTERQKAFSQLAEKAKKLENRYFPKNWKQTLKELLFGEAL
jgi:hypothetical protein